LNRIPGHWLITRGLKKLVLLDPLESGKKSMLFLFTAIAIGYVQILWGLLLGVVHSVRNCGLKKSQEPLVAFSIQLVVPVLLFAFLGLKKGLISPWVLYGLLAWLGINFLHFMILKACAQKGLMMKMFWAFYGLYGVLSGNLLGDPLSYSRLFGLGLTTSVLALAVNEMVFLTKGVPYVGFAIAGLVFLLGHAGNLAINILGGYVHSSRLQYLEFFTKFFEAGGRPFAPFAEVREYTLINKF
jgi:V/A-type H+-transporting ATPase subunit I